MYVLLLKWVVLWAALDTSLTILLSMTVTLFVRVQVGPS